MKEFVRVTQEIGRQYAKSYTQQLIARGDGIVSESIKMGANHTQVGGIHYKAVRPGQQEHWDIVATHDLDYFQGQITKYTMRWKKKGGVQDLKKALHFLQKYIELVEANVITDPTLSGQIDFQNYQTGAKMAMDAANQLRDGDQYLKQPQGPI